MQRDKVVLNIFAAGLDSELAGKAADAGLTLTDLRKMAKKDMKAHFADHEITAVVETLQRQAYPEEVVKQLVEKCDWSCCLCWKLDNRLPVILHHIKEKGKGGKDTYDNLVVLCLNHHGMAHSKWEISQAPAPPQLIANRKKEFENAIADFKEGKRCAPGREGDGSTPESQSDLQALTRLRNFMDRPAMWRKMRQEGSMKDFQDEMGNIMRALSVGKLSTRQGDDLGKIKPILSFSNPLWKERLILLRDQIDNLRLRLEMAIRDEELDMSPSGSQYVFNNPELPHELDDMKRAAASLLNTVLIQSNLPPIRGPRQE